MDMHTRARTHTHTPRTYSVRPLSLLFPLLPLPFSYQPSPFFVLDEVDASLDNVNIAKVCLQQ